MKAAEFSKTHRTDADWVKAMGSRDVAAFNSGQVGTHGGLRAVVVRHYCNGMYDIRVPGGEICVDGSEFKAAA